ncbi:MAG: PTS sugar transporter subunit IIA [Spirochaetia bacterium]
MAMRLVRYLRPECFIVDLAEKSREDALRRIIRAAAENGLVENEASVLAKLMDREKLQSTAVGNGIAIPHCFTDEVPGLIIIVARSSGGLEFDSFDGKPVRTLFLLMGNRSDYTLHLKALALIARLIKRMAFIEKIGSSTSAQDMIRAFEEEEAKVS